MNKEELKEIIREIILEITQKDITSKFPLPSALPSGDIKISMMTLGNLKSMRTKAKDLMKSDGPDYSNYWFNTYQLCNNEIIKRLKYINAPVNEGQGFNHGSTSDYGNIQFVRDPLNDPLLNNKLDETQDTYRFVNYDWMKNMAGFNMPIDVHYGAIYLGVIESKPDGYVIDRISTPSGRIVDVVKNDKNKFKTKNDAGEVLHRLWKQQRTMS